MFLYILIQFVKVHDMLNIYKYNNYSYIIHMCIHLVLKISLHDIMVYIILYILL